MTCPPELKQRYDQGRVVPFVGAGVSMSLRWDDHGAQRRGPSWAELVDRAADSLGFEVPSLIRARGTDLQILEYFRRKNAGQTARLTNWLATLSPPDDDVRNSPIHGELARLTQCDVYYTTNFDDFLERALDLHGRKPQVVAVESQMAGRGTSCRVVKFHGDLNHPDRIVLSESDYEKRLSLTTAMDYSLRADLLGRVVLFLGYSFRDPNVSYLFRLFADDFLGQPGSLTGPRAFITVPDPSDFEYELFEARRLTVIPIEGAKLTEQTAALLREMRE